MLATLTDRRFSDPGWLFERKLDGERCLAFREGRNLQLLSRRRQPLGRTYPELVDVLATQEPPDFVVDGEVVAFEDGRTSFARLQQRIGITDPRLARRSPVAVFYYLFDVLYLDGHDVTQLPLRARKAQLGGTFQFGGRLRLTRHRNTEGEDAFESACAKGWEGVIAKRADAPYRSGRSTDWLKFKCSLGQELVIGGFTEPAGSRVGLGALLVGYYEDGRLRYAGKVGTGYTEAMLRDLRRRLDPLEVPSSPFDDARVKERGVHWVRPELVAQIAFTEWTSDGKLRHPRFEGLRVDKAPSEVRRERPRGLPPVRAARAHATGKGG
ncbi:MAG TPA: non-homologous end-joining DNA ligase [Acidimicrobiales bacterium]|jgi:bifunctional non-homologous end joining protein LigD|nr:non-homologous end-joining DNA ligase [Acidimicrobiales bacterium]